MLTVVWGGALVSGGSEATVMVTVTVTVLRGSD